jgi:cellulose synthase/poly-beta-1,6-N-acetylglucosamine synthase-like glycosyltransferase
VRPLLVVAAVIVAAPGAVVALHLTVLTLASVFYRSPRPTGAQPWRLLFMIPARNEEAVIERALAALVRQQRDGDHVIVVADRCTDRTAALATAVGAEVLERPDDAPPGKSAAINDGLDHMRERVWDALVTIDADSIVSDGFVDACERILRAGAPVAQARSESLVEPGLLRQANVVAFALQGVTLPRGRDRLGVSVRLKGPGMIVRRDVIDEHPFPRSGSSEDTRYGVELAVAGVVARHCDDARVRSGSPRRLRVAGGQRVRWETGRLRLARQFVLPLLRARTATSWEAALHLATPPLAVAVLLLAVGCTLAALTGAWLLVWPLALLIGLVAVDVVVALVAARAGGRAWAALALAPVYVVWKGFLQARAIIASRAADRPFEPTARD